MPAVSTDEQAAITVNVRCIRIGKHFLGALRIRRQNKEVPVKLSSLTFTAIACLDDMAIAVRRFRVRCIWLRALRVVCQRPEHGVTVGAHRRPLRTIHRRGADEVGGDTGIHKQLSLRRKMLREHRVIYGQLKPLTGTISIETRHIKRAFRERADTATYSPLPFVS